MVGDGIVRFAVGQILCFLVLAPQYSLMDAIGMDAENAD